MMEGPNECVVPGMLATILHISRLLGGAPLQFEKQGGHWRIRLSLTLHKISCTIGFIVSMMMMWIIISKIKLEELVGPITTRITFYVQGSIVVIIAGTVWYGAPRRMGCLIASIIKAQKINLQLNIHDSPSPGEHFGRVVYYLPFNMIISIVDYVILAAIILNSSPLWAVIFLYIYNLFFALIDLSIIQFVMLVLHVRSSFISINERLKALKSLFPGKSSKFHHDTVRALRASYESACDMMDEVNSSHGLLLMMIIANIFTRLTLALYYFINNLSIEESLMSQKTLVVHQIMQLYWCIFEAIKLVILIEPCQMTYTEMKEVRVLVSLLLHHTRSVGDPLAVDLEQFCTQLILSKASFAPMDIITIKRSFLIAVLGNITTYLVILIHMK